MKNIYLSILFELFGNIFIDKILFKTISKAKPFTIKGPAKEICVYANL